jgi:large subunit ribosomal protein L23
MALLDFLKNKNNTQNAEKAKKGIKKAEQKPEKILAESAPQKAEKAKVSQPAVKQKAKKTGIFSYEAVKKPHISEKATYLSEKNQYVFQVSPGFNKTEIKKSIEGIYGVDVLSVNMVKIPAKKRRIGRREGFKKGYSKTIVKIKEGQKIEIL